VSLGSGRPLESLSYEAAKEETLFPASQEKGKRKMGYTQAKLAHQ
jgi:hypothetical protein